MTKIALLGAGGKMGVRLSTNLKDTRFDVDHVEVSEEGRARLKQTLGIECMEQGQAVSSADAIVMAVPDRLIGKILKTFVKDLRSGAKVVMLDGGPARRRAAGARGHHLFRDTSVPPAHLQ